LLVDSAIGPLFGAATWSGKLTRPGRIVHYAELRKLLIEHADQLARRIDQSADTIG
jgi:hypothetical protein